MKYIESNVLNIRTLASALLCGFISFWGKAVSIQKKRTITIPKGYLDDVDFHIDVPEYCPLCGFSPFHTP